MLFASEADHEVVRGLPGVTRREWKPESKQGKCAGAQSSNTSIREWKELATLSYGAIIPSQDSGNSISHLSSFLLAYEHFTLLTPTLRLPWKINNSVNYSCITIHIFLPQYEAFIWVWKCPQLTCPRVTCPALCTNAVSVLQNKKGLLLT